MNTNLQIKKAIKAIPVIEKASIRRGRGTAATWRDIYIWLNRSFLKPMDTPEKRRYLCDLREKIEKIACEIIIKNEGFLNTYNEGFNQEPCINIHIYYY